MGLLSLVSLMPLQRCLQTCPELIENPLHTEHPGVFSCILHTGNLLSSSLPIKMSPLLSGEAYTETPKTDENLQITNDGSFYKAHAGKRVEITLCFSDHL